MLDDEPAAGRRERGLSRASDSLILDFLNWLAASPRPYAEVMERWRTSCPRLTVWEDAVDLGYVVRRREPPGPPMILLTAAGRRMLSGSLSARPSL
jgi:hypothetical protein